MALNVPITSPLTQTQAELTSKIGSMKTLLSLPISTNLNIPKSEQISTFDYLVKIMRAIGLEPELVINTFLSKVFDEAGTFLEEKVLFAVADSMGEKGRSLPNTINPTASRPQKEQFKENNRNYLLNLVPNNFLQVSKQQLAKNLTLMIFGPRNGNAANVLNTSASERNRLIDEAVCAQSLFSLSSDPISNPQDVEYNRIALRQQLEKGEVIIEVNCQDVKIKLPEDPGYIFEGGGIFSAPGANPPTPAQSLNILVQHVKNQGQNINNEQNSNSIGKSFQETLVLKLLNYISSLVFPFLGPIFTAISSDPAASGLDATNIAYSNCIITNTANDPSQNPREKQEFLRSLANGLLRELLRLMLVVVIREFKRLVSNYFAKTARERQRRRAEKVRQRFELFNGGGQAAENLSKSRRYAIALSSLNSILNT